MIDFLVNGLVGGILADIIPDKVFPYIFSFLMAIAGLAFGFIVGYMIYDVILEPKDTIKIVFVTIMSLIVLALSIGSFYLMKRAWASRN